MGVKQVIVIRTDLKMRRGKECAQCAHASSLFLTKKFDSNNFSLNDDEKKWLFEKTGDIALRTKIVVEANSADQLMEIYEKALQAGLETNLMVDAGITEFYGIPTPTCVAIGPNEATKIDAVTGHLRIR